MQKNRQSASHQIRKSIRSNTTAIKSPNQEKNTMKLLKEILTDLATIFPFAFGFLAIFASIHFYEINFLPSLGLEQFLILTPIALLLTAIGVLMFFSFFKSLHTLHKNIDANITYPQNSSEIISFIAPICLPILIPTFILLTRPHPDKNLLWLITSTATALIYLILEKIDPKEKTNNAVFYGIGISLIIYHIFIEKSSVFLLPIFISFLILYILKTLRNLLINDTYIGLDELKKQFINHFLISILTYPLIHFLSYNEESHLCSLAQIFSYAITTLAIILPVIFISSIKNNFGVIKKIIIKTLAIIFIFIFIKNMVDYPAKNRILIPAITQYSNLSHPSVTISIHKSELDLTNLETWACTTNDNDYVTLSDVNVLWHGLGSKSRIEFTTMSGEKSRLTVNSDKLNILTNSKEYRYCISRYASPLLSFEPYPEKEYLSVSKESMPQILLSDNLDALITKFIDDHKGGIEKTIKEKSIIKINVYGYPDVVKFKDVEHYKSQKQVAIKRASVVAENINNNETIKKYISSNQLKVTPEPRMFFSTSSECKKSDDATVLMDCQDNNRRVEIEFVTNNPHYKKSE
jgi:hypothetical protein